MKYTLPALALFGVFLLQPTFGSAAQADATSAPHKPKFEDCDTNKDGFLSKEEFQIFRPRNAEHFAAIDKDGNGLVSREELKAWRDARRAERGSRWRNKNRGQCTDRSQFLREFRCAPQFYCNGKSRGNNAEKRSDSRVYQSQSVILQALSDPFRQDSRGFISSFYQY